MCGIVAIIAKDTPIERDTMNRALASLIPRGPDGQDSWFSTDRLAALGHTRLNIIDLETGSQPIASEDGRMHIIVNGEFYDHERITRELKARGHVFRSRSDSEIALHLYQESGIDCLEHLRGEFAFAIWDEDKRQLFAARDRFGIKPLFYADDGRTLRLASEAKALFAAGCEAAWDKESVFQNLYFSFDQDRTLFKNVRQVPPGHYLIARDGRVSIHRYWDADFPARKRLQQHLSEDVHVEQVRSLINEAVRFRMRADVPVGCYLSGGVDSSSVLGIASRYAEGKFTAFTIVFDHPDFDESASSLRSAEAFGADFRPIYVSGQDFADVFEEAVWRGEMIHYNAHGAARFQLSRAVRGEGYKVVVGGEGADELFAGYDFSSQALLNGTSGGFAKIGKILARLLHPKTETERRIAATSPWLARLSKGLAFPPHLTDYVADKFVLLNSIIDRDFAQEFTKRDPYREFFRQFDYRKTLLGREPARQIIYLWMKSLFVNYVLAADRLDMANSVEVRLPFLDHKLFEYVRTLPGELLAKNGTIKYLLREAVKPYVTDEVYRTPKKPFLAPPTTRRIDDAMYIMLRDIVSSQGFANVPFFDNKAVREVLDSVHENESTRTSLDPLLFAMASYAVLQKTYFP